MDLKNLAVVEHKLHKEYAELIDHIAGVAVLSEQMVMQLGCLSASLSYICNEYHGVHKERHEKVESAGHSHMHDAMHGGGGT